MQIDSGSSLSAISPYISVITLNNAADYRTNWLYWTVGQWLTSL